MLRVYDLTVIRFEGFTNCCNGNGIAKPGGSIGPQPYLHCGLLTIQIHSTLGQKYRSTEPLRELSVEAVQTKISIYLRPREPVRSKSAQYGTHFGWCQIRGIFTKELEFIGKECDNPLPFEGTKSTPARRY